MHYLAIFVSLCLLAPVFPITNKEAGIELIPLSDIPVKPQAQLFPLSWIKVEDEELKVQLIPVEDEQPKAQLVPLGWIPVGKAEKEPQGAPKPQLIPLSWIKVESEAPVPQLIPLSNIPVADP